MTGQTVILSSAGRREFAKRLIDQAPDYAVCAIKAGDRTPDQNAMMWAMLSAISRAKPDGRRHTPEVWKALMMQACGYAVQFEAGLVDGSPFPVGFRSSKLTKPQMSELLEFIMAYAAQHGISLDETTINQGE
jgi:hypothetical protein